MKKTLLTLIDRVDEIGKLFRHFIPSPGLSFPEAEYIYDVPEFIEWKQSIIFELQEIYDATGDQYISKLIGNDGLLNRFDGNNFGEEEIFTELSVMLKVIKKNIDKYYPAKQGGKQHGKTDSSQHITNYYNFTGDIKGSNIATGEKPKQTIGTAKPDKKSWFEKYGIATIIGALITAAVAIYGVISNIN